MRCELYSKERFNSSFDNVINLIKQVTVLTGIFKQGIEMLKTKNVFVDTECYVHSKLNLDSPAFNKLKELCAEQKLVHITTTTVVMEVKRKIAESIKEATNAMNKFQREGQILKSLKSDNLSHLFEKVNEEDANKKAQEVFADYLNACKVTKAYAREIDGEDLLDRYFNRKVPFTKDKNNEFRDSISLLSLIKCLEDDFSHDNAAYVVSGDKGLEKYCEDYKHLYHVPSLDQMVDLYNEHSNERTIKVKEYFESIEAVLKESVKEYIEDCEVYNFSTWENAELDHFKVKSVDIYEPSVISIDDDECQIVFGTNILIEVGVTGPDFEHGVYDKEDGKWYVFENTTRVEEIELELDADLLLRYTIENGEFTGVEVDELYIDEAFKGIEVSVEEHSSDEYD